MPAEKDGWHPTQQFELVHFANHADVQKAVIRGSLRCYFHSAAVSMRITYSNKERWPSDFPLCGGYAHVRWLECNQGPQSGQDISTPALQPLWHTVGTGIGFRVHPYTCYTAKEYFFAAGADHSQVNLSDIFSIRAKLLPGSQSDVHAADSQRFCKVIAAARRNHKHGNILPMELKKMAMDGAIAPEDQGRRKNYAMLKI